MELIINIHKKDYQSILNSGQVPYGVVCAIMNGTPLPKGHGRIIDESKIEVCEWVDVLEEDYPKASTDAPTIIEAEKEG